MASIIITSLARVERVVEKVKATHLITLLNAGTSFDRPARIAKENHLFLGIHDLLEEREGLDSPSFAHVAAICAFAGRWDRKRPLVINCWAGISRSTAAGFIAMCHLYPDVNEALFARQLRDQSSCASPNPFLVELADQFLGRQGRMIAALEAIGSGDDVMAEVNIELEYELEHETHVS